MRGAQDERKCQLVSEGKRVQENHPLIPEHEEFDIPSFQKVHVSGVFKHWSILAQISVLDSYAKHNIIVFFFC